MLGSATFWLIWGRETHNVVYRYREDRYHNLDRIYARLQHVPQLVSSVQEAAVLSFGHFRTLWAFRIRVCMESR